MAQEELWRRTAGEIAERILASARRAQDGRIYWLQPELAGRPGARPALDSFFYPGSTGVALFFAQAAAVLERPDYALLAGEILEPLRAELGRLAADPAKMAALELRQGGLVGAGSWVYGFLRLGDLLGDPILWDEALQLSLAITPEKLERSESFELMEGIAGTLLALLALDARRPQANAAGAAPLELAELAGRRLLERRESWLGAAHGAGLCHGAAGILLALQRLEQRSPEPRRRAFLEQQRSSLAAAPPLPADGERPALLAGNSWCNGRTGILLARLELEEGSPAPLAAELRELARLPLDAADHLCCGNFGRIDLLVHAAEVLDDKQLHAAAERLAAEALARGEAEGGFRLMFHPQGRDDVRLFPGISGVGYGFLRLADKKSLSTILTMR